MTDSAVGRKKKKFRFLSVVGQFGKSMSGSTDMKINCNQIGLSNRHIQLSSDLELPFVIDPTGFETCCRMEMDGYVFFIIFACLAGFSLQSDYTAVVVEYSPHPETAKNIRKYVDIIDIATKRYPLDLIVFPEESLSINETDTSLVPNPDEKIVPHKNETYAKYPPIRVMSEMAARYRVYLVVNLFERFECKNKTDCPDRGYFLYNTNVAFDRNGTVVARYRKYNLFNKNVDKPKVAELSTFTTDFNVTFGMFICFDILFKSPAMDLVQKMNVRNIIFSTYWFGELPFLTAVQMQAGWAYAMDANLFASGVNIPEQGSTGSGVYRKGRRNSCMVEKEMDVLLTKELSNVLGGPKETGGLKLKENESVRRATGKDLDPSGGRFNDRICYKNFCCRFNISYRRSNAVNDGNYTYRAVAFNDKRDFSDKDFHEEIFCGVLLCSNGNCAKKPSTGNYPLIFDEMTIDADFKWEDTFQMPSTLVWTGDYSDVSLLDTLGYEDYSFDRKNTTEKGVENVSIRSKKGGVDKLITFAIYGRKFD